MPKAIKRRVAGSPIEGLSPLMSRLYANRGVTHASEVDYSLKHMLSPDGLRGIDTAAELLADAIQNQRHIMIVGDFDADGATSCALLVQGFRDLRAGPVSYLVPNRFDYVYGLTPEIVDVANLQSPDLIVTVDNGISSIDGVAHATSLGIKTIITDHHLPGHQLPDAAAIVNPNQPHCEFQSKNLAGVGVSFYLLSAVRKQLRQSNWFAEQAEPNLAQYLDLVALGTIADVVPMDYNNRILVNEGLRRMRAGRIRPGLAALLRISGTRIETVASMDLGFGVAPRLNAAGRLEDISLGIDCLLAQDDNKAGDLATQLDQLNLERRDIEKEMKQQALASLGSLEKFTTPNALMGVCLHEAEWHQGVVGIVASRIKDKIHRPVIAFASSGPNELKGSARSIKGLHIRDALDAIASQNPGLIEKFGGHAMAAGLTLAEDKFDTFAKAFDLEARRWLQEEDLAPVILSDGPIGEDFTVELARELAQSSPWGQGFPDPMFDDEFEILDQRIVGGSHLKLKLAKVENGQVIDAIAFNQGQLLESRYQTLAYRTDVNEFRGMITVQLIVEPK